MQNYLMSGFEKFIDANGKVWFKQQIAYLNSSDKLEILYFIEPTFRELCEKVEYVRNVLDNNPNMSLTEEDLIYVDTLIEQYNSIKGQKDVKADASKSI